MVTMAAMAGLLALIPATPVSGQASSSQGVIEEALADSAMVLTLKGFAACTSREQLHRLITLVAEKDSEGYERMVTDPKSGCFLLKEGLEMKPIGFNAAYLEMQPVGMKGTIWTVLEAVERKPPARRP